MSKKNGKQKNVKVNTVEQDEMIRMIKVLGIVVVAMISFYLIFSIASGEISFGGKKKQEVSIQNTIILAGNSFNRQEESYYVLMYDFKKDDSVVYANIYDMFGYISSEKMYLVDLSSKFNEKYITENESEINIESNANLKIVNGTLLKIENGKAVSKAVGSKEIEKILFNNN